MIKELAELSAERLNMFPAKHGVSSYYSPEALVTGRILNFNKHCKYSFGEYVQAYHENIKKSDMTERTIDAVYLRTNNNYQGGHICMNLNSGMRLTTSKVTPIPMTDIVKEKVEEMALKQGINKVKFTNKKGIDLPNADWIAGVDYDKYYDEDDISDDEDEVYYDEEDEDSDEEFNEEINQEELDEVIPDIYNAGAYNNDNE